MPLLVYQAPPQAPGAGKSHDKQGLWPGHRSVLQRKQNAQRISLGFKLEMLTVVQTAQSNPGGKNNSPRGASLGGAALCSSHYPQHHPDSNTPHHTSLCAFNYLSGESPFSLLFDHQVPEMLLFLLLLPQGWDYKCVPLGMASMQILRTELKFSLIFIFL